MVEILFGGKKYPVLGPEQKLDLDGISFYLSFVGVAIVHSLLKKSTDVIVPLWKTLLDYFSTMRSLNLGL